MKIEENAHECAICQISFSMLHTLAKHNALLHSFADKPSKVSPIKIKIKQNPKNLESGKLKIYERKLPYSCQKCQKCFKNISLLKRHDLLHTGTTGTDSKFDGKKKDFECPTCHMAFTNNSNMKRHVSFIHEDGKRHICPRCGKSFGTKEYVKEHVNIVHERKKPFKCDYCQLRFGRKSDLKSHVSFNHKNVSTK